MTEETIQRVIAKGFWKNNICIPNVLMYLDKGYYEADLIMISKSEYVTEIEIKLTIMDFMADFKKRHFHSSPEVRRLYYAFPEKMYKTHADVIYPQLAELGIGIITVCLSQNGLVPKIVLEPCKIRSNKKLTLERKMELLKVGCMKWFMRKGE